MRDGPARLFTPVVPLGREVRESCVRIAWSGGRWGRPGGETARPEAIFRRTYAVVPEAPEGAAPGERCAATINVASTIVPCGIVAYFPERFEPAKPYMQSQVMQQSAASAGGRTQRCRCPAGPQQSVDLRPAPREAGSGVSRYRRGEAAGCPDDNADAGA